MPVGVVKTKRDEHLWEKAKKAASSQGKRGKSFWPYVMGVYKNMKGGLNKKASLDSLVFLSGYLKR